MKKIIIFLIVAMWAFTNINADPWHKNLTFNFNLAETQYSKSWTGGDVGSLTWISTLNGIFEKQFGLDYNNRTNIVLAFGQTLSQDLETKNWRKPQKSTDQIDIDNLSRYTAFKYVDPYFSVRLESQFLDASVETIDRYFNPLLFTEAVGLSRTFYKKEKDLLMSRLGAAVRERVLRQIVDTAAQTKEWDTEVDGGIESVTDLTYSVSGNLDYVGKLTLFKAFFNSDKDKVKGTPLENDWKTIDVNWENAVTASIVKYVTVSLYVQFLYDKQIAKRGRIKQTLGLGITYQLL